MQSVPGLCDAEIALEWAEAAKKAKTAAGATRAALIALSYVRRAYPFRDTAVKGKARAAYVKALLTATRKNLELRAAPSLLHALIRVDERMYAIF